MIVEFTEHVEACLAKAFEMYGVKLSPNCVKITYNLRGKSAGQACTKGPTDYTLRFNREAIEKHWDDMVNNTIPHEVAHLIAWMVPHLKAAGHNRQWKRLCVSLGGTGARCHSYGLTSARKKTKYVYVINGLQCAVGVIVHNRIQRGRRYKCQAGAVLKTHFSHEVIA